MSQEKILTDAIHNYIDNFCGNNGRDDSWKHCYECFMDERDSQSPNEDYLSLQLAFYLASWGMYRGSSFLLQKDYKIHIPVVKEILKDENRCLVNLRYSEMRKYETQERIINLKNVIEELYKGVRREVRGREVKSDVSNVLITKIFLGTLGCVPAYDEFFIGGIKELGADISCRFGKESLDDLAEFYENNQRIFVKIEDDIRCSKSIDLPQMKIVDMAFWQIGYEKNLERKMKKS